MSRWETLKSIANRLYFRAHMVLGAGRGYGPLCPDCKWDNFRLGQMELRKGDSTL